MAAAASMFLSSRFLDESGTTFSPSTEVATLPATNLQKRHPARVWRSTEKSPYIVVTTFSANIGNAFAIVGHNASSSAQWRVRAAFTLGALTTTPVYDSGTISMWPASGKPVDEVLGFPYLCSFVTFTNTINNLFYWRMDITDPSNANNFECGRMFLGTAVFPTINMSNDPIIQPVTKGEQRRSDFNYVSADDRGVNGRRLSLPYGSIDRVDFRKYILPFQMYHGVSKDFFFCADIAAQEERQMYSGQFLFEDTPSNQRQKAFNLNGAKWAAQMVLTEMT